jgi:Cys-tRNA(Pro)/Cys-tRNA(Cys) deacylase
MAKASKARRASEGSAATPALAALLRAGVTHTVHRYEDPPEAATYGEAVAVALGVDPRRLFKTLIATVDGALTVGIVPVAASLDLKALAATCGSKRAAMADPAAAERATGYVTGGISPIGQRTRLPTVIDNSAFDWPSVFVSAGRRGLQVELAPEDLARFVGAPTARIAT